MGLVWFGLAQFSFRHCFESVGSVGAIGERLWVIFVPLGPVLPGPGLKPADDPFVLRYAVWPLRPRRLYSQQVGIPVTPGPFRYPLLDWNSAMDTSVCNYLSNGSQQWLAAAQWRYIWVRPDVLQLD